LLSLPQSLTGAPQVCEIVVWLVGSIQLKVAYGLRGVERAIQAWKTLTWTQSCEAEKG